jgi:hypothetical protein
MNQIEQLRREFIMRMIKIIYLVPVLLLFIAVSGNAGPARLTAATENELREQLGDEIETALQERFLRYSSDDLDGIVLIEATVNKEGKIVFKGLNAENDNLRENAYGMLNSLNLWTYPDFAETIYRYKVTYTD